MATPRATRARTKTPLPAIAAKQSAAYGARGKADLETQVRSSGADFGEAFDETRGAAAPAAERRSAEPAPPPPAHPVAVPARPGTLLQAHPGYGRADAGGAAERRQPSTRRDFLYVFLHILLVLSGVVSLLTGFAFVPLPSPMAETRDAFYFELKLWFHIKPYDLPHESLEYMWNKFKHDRLFEAKDLPTHNMPGLQWSINIHFLERIQRIEGRLKDIDGILTLQQETMTMLHETLPSHVVVQVVDGEYVIPDAFWHALQERLTEDNDMAPLWQSYIRRNEHEIEQLNQRLVSLILDRALEEKRVISKEAFMRAISKNNDELAMQFNGQFHALQKMHHDEVRDIAADTALDVLDKSPAGQFARDQLKELVTAHTVYNQYRKLREVNWFSPGLGARINTALTSSTKMTAHHWLGRMWVKLSSTALKPFDPLVALMHWEEATECWCSPSNKSQISVTIPNKVYPHSLVVEHIPADGTRDIKAAPKDIEIWAELDSVSAARNAAEVILAEKVRHSESICQGTAPTPSHVCIGTAFYNIHIKNHVQSFELFRSAREMALGVNRFTIKVISNHGGKHTCLYRVRLTGQSVIPDGPED